MSFFVVNAMRYVSLLICWLLPNIEVSSRMRIDTTLGNNKYIDLKQLAANCRIVLCKLHTVYGMIAL